MVQYGTIIATCVTILFFIGIITIIILLYTKLCNTPTNTKCNVIKPNTQYTINDNDKSNGILINGDCIPSDNTPCTVDTNAIKGIGTIINNSCILTTGSACKVNNEDGVVDSNSNCIKTTILSFVHPNNEMYVFDQGGAMAQSSSLVNPVTWNEQQTFKRLQAADSVLPLNSSQLSNVDPDALYPSTLTYQQSLPTLTLKNLQSLDADPVRGDIPVTIYPDVNVVGKSRFDRDSLRLDGAFSNALNSKYAKLSMSDLN